MEDFVVAMVQASHFVIVIGIIALIIVFFVLWPWRQHTVHVQENDYLVFPIC